MIAFADVGSLTQILQIVLLDLLLAGDNAVVIAMAVRTLPPREQRLGRLWGTVGAVALRALFLAMATWLMAIPWLKFAGGALLLWIAYKLLAPAEHGVVEAGAAGEAGGHAAKIKAGESLRAAIKIIILADASMSLDNVFAVTGAAQGHFGLAAAGIALSIPIVVWGSSLLSRIIEHHRWVVWLGGGVLGHVAGVLMIEEQGIVAWFGKSERPALHPIAVALGIGFTLFGWWASRHHKRRAAKAAAPDEPAAG